MCSSNAFDTQMHWQGCIYNFTKVAIMDAKLIEFSAVISSTSLKIDLLRFELLSEQLISSPLSGSGKVSRETKMLSPIFHLV